MTIRMDARINFFGRWDLLSQIARQTLFIRIKERIIDLLEGKLPKIAKTTLEDVIKSGRFAKLHPYTVSIHGVSTPLLGRGFLLNTIETDKGDNFVTIGYGAKKGTHGGLRSNTAKTIAAIHEDGAIINVTRRMRRFLAARGFFVKTGSIIVIPPRPFIDKAADEVLPKAQFELLRAAQRAINEVI